MKVKTGDSPAGYVARRSYEDLYNKIKACEVGHWIYTEVEPPALKSMRVSAYAWSKRHGFDITTFTQKDADIARLWIQRKSGGE